MTIVKSVHDTIEDHVLADETITDIKDQDVAIVKSVHDTIEDHVLADELITDIKDQDVATVHVKSVHDTTEEHVSIAKLVHDTTFQDVSVTVFRKGINKPNKLRSMVEITHQKSPISFTKQSLSAQDITMQVQTEKCLNIEEPKNNFQEIQNATNNGGELKCSSSSSVGAWLADEESELYRLLKEAKYENKRLAADKLNLQQVIASFWFSSDIDYGVF